jgi:hypothetical protein
MAITTLTYEPPVRRSTRQASLDYELLETADSLAESGRHLESLTKVFEHLFPEKKAFTFTGEGFSFTQGSSRVTTKIENDDVVISVPLVSLPSGGSAIAALRYVLTEISATGQLYQPRLRGEDIHLEMRERLSRIHPAKVLEVLRRMPAEADECDDFLIGQFSAKALDRAAITPLGDDEIERCERIWRQHWSDVEELLPECQRKRSMFFLNELTAYAMQRVRFALPLHGFLRSRLEEAGSTFDNTDVDPMKRESALGKCIKEMKAISRDELKQNLGHASYAIRPVSDGTPKALGNYFGPDGYMETINGLRKGGKPMDAALGLVCTFNYFLARFAWDEPVEVAMKEALAEASGKPWREQASLLAEKASEIFEKFGEEDDDDDDDEEDGDEEEEEDDDDGDEDGEDEDEEGDE